MSHRDTYRALLEAIVHDGDLIAMRYFRAIETRIDRKKDGSVVTQADREIEQMSREKVAASGLPLEVLGEEMGGRNVESANTDGRARLIIDPIDGTEEFSRGIPTFGTLLGIEEAGVIVAGMVSAPALRTRWCAYRGEGAFRDGQKIQVSKTARLADAMIFTTGTGPKKDASDRAALRRLHDAARNSRSLGGFWQHMLVAEGAIDAAVDWTSMPWDLAPLGLIVEEAGGRSTNLQGQRTIYGSGQFISTNGLLHEKVLAVLTRTSLENGA